MSEHAASRGKLILAFAAVYLIWGSTYLAIRYSIETIPPFLMAGARFITSGIILYLLGRAKGAVPLGRSGWRSAAIIGFLLLVCGNGAVVVAEQWVPSGLTALLVAMTPMWVSLLAWIAPGGKRPTGQVAGGILLGILGVTLLIDFNEVRHGGVDLAGAGILTFGSICWAGGSLYARNAKVSTSTLMTAAMQMLWGGTALVLAGILTGEHRNFAVQNVAATSLIALLYLTVFGAIIGYTAYSWLVTATTPARAATYAYVNPAVAVFLGWSIAGEPLTGRMLLAMGVIVSAVIVITNAKH
jgi:drug/metabolite transporter (DMT)-like permease